MLAPHILLAIDLPAATAALLTALLCALTGSLLLLRRRTLVGDALSHSVLPGIVGAFLLWHSLKAPAMLAGASVAALLTLALAEAARRGGRLEAGAALGVAFTFMFAIGVVMLEQSGTAGLHIDIEHTLYGNVEGIIWPQLADAGSLTFRQLRQSAPHELTLLALALALNVAFLLLFAKEARLAAFDPDWARLFLRPRWLVDGALMLLCAFSIVAAFQATGAILTVALLAVPAATARIVTNSWRGQFMAAAACAAVAAIVGYGVAVFLPAVLGWRHALNAGGMMALVAGALLAAAILSRRGMRRRSPGAG